jgi:hypothetical protein
VPSVDNTKRAVLVANMFITRYHPQREVRRTYRDTAKNVWYVEFAVGRDGKGTAKVSIDATSGEVVGYESSG